MSEFEVFEPGGQRRVYLVQAGSIARISPAGSSGTLIVLGDGRQLSAAVPYPRVREAVLTVRNQVVSHTRGTNGDRSFSLLGWRQAP